MSEDLELSLKEANLERRRFRTVLESIAMNVWVASREGESVSIICGRDEVFGDSKTTVEERLSAIHPDDLPKLRDLIDRVWSDEEQLDITIRGSDGQGGWKSFLVRSVPLQDEHGVTQEWVGVTIDVSRIEANKEELREQKQVLLASQERLSIALEASEMGVYDADLRHSTVICSPEVERIVGSKVGTNTKSIVAELIHQDDRLATTEYFQQSIASGKPLRCEMRAVSPAGATRWLSVTGKPYFDELGNPIRIIGAVHDVTARRLADEWLRAQNQVLELLVSGVPVSEILESITLMLESGLQDAFCTLLLVDSEGGMHFAAGLRASSEYARAIDGVKIGPKVGSCGAASYYKEPVISEDVLTDELWKDFHELAARYNFRSCSSFPILAAPSTGSFSGDPCKCNKGTLLGTLAVYRNYRSKPSPEELVKIQRAVQLASLALERDRNEKTVLESERRFRELANAMPQLVWTTDPTGQCTFSNRMLSESIGDGLTLNWDDAVHPEDRAEALNRHLASIKTGEPYSMEHRLKMLLSGEYRWFLARAIASRDTDGNIDGWYGTATDIDELKKTEQALRMERDRVSAIAAASPSALFSCVLTPDKQSYFTYAAPAMEELFGVSAADLRRDGENLHKYTEPSDLPRIREAAINCIATLEGGESKEPLVHVEFRVNHPTRGQIWIECLASTRMERGVGVCWHGCMTDVTRRKGLESKLLQSEKIEAIVTLAGGIAHDFNNLLTVVLGSCHLLEVQLHGREQELVNVEAIRHASQRAANLTKQMLAFSRQQEIAPQTVNVNNLINESRLILQRLIGNSQVLRFELLDSLKNVFADPTQLEQILINLVINSRDATPEEGEICVSTNNVFRRGPVADNATRPQEKYFVEIAVADNGQGMPSEIQTRIFDPFFTTKQTGTGTGLGLAVVHGIATQNGGFVEVESQVGIGTTIRVFLPATQQQPRQIVLDPSMDEETEIGQVVLVVDDERAIADIIRRTLQAEGYNVFVATSAAEALQVFHELKGAIDVLITDIIMPDCDGEQLAEMLIEEVPQLKVMLMSGHSSKSIDSTLNSTKELVREFEFLGKPFTPNELLLQLRQMCSKK